MQMRERPLLSVEKLSYYAEKSTPLLEEISCRIEEGTLTLLTGANGSGKSLFVRALKGLISPKSGQIFWGSESVTKEPAKRMQRIGLVFQDAETQVVGQTVEKDIRFGMENLGLGEREQEQRLTEVYELLDLRRFASRRPKSLSGGEKRRLAIAGVVVMQPGLLILDEPFANLDWHSALSVMEVLLRLKRAGHTILIVSHEVEKILAHAQQVLVLEDGRLVLSGNAEEVYPHLRKHGVYVPADTPIEELSWLKR